MTTFQTLNPLGSKDPRDLYDNAENYDAAMNDRDHEQWTDRFGVSRPTWYGVEQRVNQFIQSSGWELPPLPYIDGIPLPVARPTQLIERDGNLYSIRLPASFPVTLSGTWVDDEPMLTVRSDQALRQQLAEANGAEMVGLIREGTTPQYSTTVYDWYQTTMINAVTDYGMVPDFDPQPGTVNGTNNLVAIQRLMDDLALMPGRKVVVFPAGNYYFNWDGTSNVGGVGVLWGRVGAGLSNVTFFGYGATFYGGSAGRFHGVFNANHGVLIKGLSAICYAGGTISTSRQNDACFSCNYNCYGVTFEDVYIANCLGDCVYLGGSLENGSLTGLFCRDISIKNSILKERYGNGTRSYYTGGTRSRLAIAVIDCIGLTIENCTIIGGIDFEPNADGQNLRNINVKNNVFHQGNYSAYTGSNPFMEETVNSGSQVIRGDIRFQSIAGGGIISQNINITGNSFYYGFLRQTATAISDVVWSNNHMYRGIFALAHDSGTNSNEGARINGLTIDHALAGLDDDIFELKGSGTTPPGIPAVAILLQGNIAYARISEITAGKSSGQFSYLFYADPNHAAGDNGRCTISDCYIPGAPISNFSFSSSTEILGTTSMPSSGIGSSKFSRITADSISNTIGTVQLSNSGAISWVINCKSNLDVTASTTGLSITGISNSPEVGSEVRIRNAGSNSFTLASGTSFYLRGGINVVLDDGRKIVTFQQIASGTWIEIYRNF
ncbi:hypothetical protein [Pseudomonas aeruginosa]|uniref:hypothetical protein n=1 Tax=Pseudomonas aeruginosa TaxID=287 RepID=UPI0034D1B39A